MRSSAAEREALVPYHAAAASTPLFDRADVQAAVVQYRDLPTSASDFKLQTHILADCLNSVSKVQMAKKLGCSRRTATKQLRLIAFCLVMVRRRWALQDLRSFDSLLHQHFPAVGDVKRLNFICKYKSDEMSMRVRVKAGDSIEFAVAKIMQIVPYWVAQWRVKEKYVRLHMPLPAVLKPIEATNTKCVKASLELATRFPDDSRLFATETRMSIADLHVSNQGADQVFMRDNPTEIMNRWHCFAHVEIA